MKISMQDAFNIFELEPIQDLTQDTIKAKHKELVKKYHPDLNHGIDDQMIKLINSAYDTLKDYNPSKEFKSFKKESGLSEKYKKALEVCLNLDNVITELCGTWIWLSGDTKAHKDKIKESKLFKWSPNKSMWYFRPDEYKVYNREKRDMMYIRSTYGSKIVKKDEKSEYQAIK